MQKETLQLKLVLAGHVDHGKSTLIGRLLHDTGSLDEAKLKAIQQSAVKRGVPFEWGFLTDALQSERDQAVTIDVSHIALKLKNKIITIIDAPGHHEFLRNMLSGAAEADAALLLIDAEEGVKEQTQRHGYLLHLLGITQVAVVINKMDKLGYDEKKFWSVAQDISNYLAGLGIAAIATIPLSAKEGENIITASVHMPWFDGPNLLEILNAFKAKVAKQQPYLRIPIQDIYRQEEKRILVGRVENGALSLGDEVLFSPSNMSAKVSSFEVWPEEHKKKAEMKESIAFTIDKPLFVERGMVASGVKNPPIVTNAFRGRLIWLDKKPLRIGDRLTLKIHTAEYACEVRGIEHVISTTTLQQSTAEEVNETHIADVVIRVRGQVATDAYTNIPELGRFVLVRGFDTVAAGIVNLDGFVDQRVMLKDARASNLSPNTSSISRARRTEHYHHRAGVLWFTGLSGAGKSTLAYALQEKLFAQNCNVMVLDGDNIRSGLCRDLSFSKQERNENIRRVAEVAKLFVEAGCIVITSFISPTEEDRNIARFILGEDYLGIYIHADVAACEARDTKGLYKKARAGEIKEFTGISSPFDAPVDPDLMIDTEKTNVEESLEKLWAFTKKQFISPAQ